MLQKISEILNANLYILVFWACLSNLGAKKYFRPSIFNFYSGDYPLTPLGLMPLQTKMLQKIKDIR